MFGSLGFTELMLIFAVALIVFGPRRLPEIGRSIGKALGEFRRATTELKSTLEEEVRLEDSRPSVAPPDTAARITPPIAPPASQPPGSATEVSNS